MNSKESQKNLLKLALVFEGSLAMVYVLDRLYQDQALAWVLPTWREVLFGILSSQALFVFNRVLVRVSIKRRWTIFVEFLREMIFPIASGLTVFSALLISLSAGIGEELFFRGFLQPKIGILGASAIFGLIHFVFNLKKYYLIVILYIFIGMLFGLIYEFFGGLWAPVIFHCFYDFSALLYFKRHLEKGTFKA